MALGNFGHFKFYDKELYCYLTLYHTILSFNDPEKESYWKHSGNQDFLHFPQCFLLSRNKLQLGDLKFAIW